MDREEFRKKWGEMKHAASLIHKDDWSVKVFYDQETGNYDVRIFGGKDRGIYIIGTTSRERGSDGRMRRYYIVTHGFFCFEDGQLVQDMLRPLITEKWGIDRPFSEILNIHLQRLELEWLLEIIILSPKIPK